MGILNIFKNKEKKKDFSKKESAIKPVAKTDKPSEKKVKEVKKPAAKTKEVSKSSDKQSAVKGKSNQAYRILVRPLITEKASELGDIGKYIFAVDPTMNKIEIAKAIRTVYGVDPVKVNVLTVIGRKVRYGRITGKTKKWKKAIITLKPGDKIEVYEGV